MPYSNFLYTTQSGQDKCHGGTNVLNPIDNATELSLVLTTGQASCRMCSTKGGGHQPSAELQHWSSRAMLAAVDRVCSTVTNMRLDSSQML
jgi:hypothetical protein